MKRERKKPEKCTWQSFRRSRFNFDQYFRKLLRKRRSKKEMMSMATKHESRQHEERNLPIPLVLFTSYIAAEKSDKLIKVFFKELPSILKKINDSKKALENKTKSVYRLKEDIIMDLKKLELANIVLKEIYKEEEISKLDKEREIQLIHSQISSSKDCRKIMNNALIQYSHSKEILDSVAVESSQYSNARALIHSYLTLQAMNEKFITDEYDFTTHFKNTEREDVEVQNLLLKCKHDVMIREKQFESLLNKCQVLRNINYKLTHSVNAILHYRMQEHLTKLQTRRFSMVGAGIYIDFECYALPIDQCELTTHTSFTNLYQRWAYDICQKIGTYKETSLCTENFFKLLNEIQEFVVFARRILLKLEQESI